MKSSRQFHAKRHRRGMMSLEVVMSTTVTMTIAFSLLLLGIYGCRLLYTIMSTVICWPFF